MSEAEELETRNFHINFNVEYYKEHKRYPDPWKISDAHHQHKMREVLEESENHFKYQTEKKSVDFIDGVLSTLNHLKTKIKEG